MNSDSGWTHVWVSIGANDLPELGCNAAATIKSRLAAAINYIKNEAANVQIVFTGYPISAKPVGCSISQTYANVIVPMQELANADPKVTFEDFGSASDGVGSPTARANANCGGSTDPDGVPPCRGNWTYFFESYGDGLHMNKDGFAKAWALPQIQSVFGCYTDDDTGFINEAATNGYDVAGIDGCMDVAWMCTGSSHSPAVQQYCKKTCTAGCTSSR
jgi:hypothetical protein